MKQYLLLVKTLVKNNIRASKIGRSGKVSQGLVVAFCFVPLIAVLCKVLHDFTILAVEVNVVPEIAVAIVTGVQAFVLLFAAQGIVSKLYGAQDNAFLSTMPTPPLTIFFAKLTVIYLDELTMCAVTLIPTLLTIGITAQVHGSITFYGFYPIVLVVTLLAPVLPMLLSSIISLPLIRVGKLLKRNAILGTIVTILVYASLFAAYMILIPRVEAQSQNISVATIKSLKTLSNVTYPNKVLIRFAMGIDIWKNLGITLGIYLGLLIITVGLIGVFYSKAVTLQLETPKSKKEKGIALSSRSVLASLLVRDFKSMLRYPVLALSSLVVVITYPIVLAVMFLSLQGEEPFFSAGVDVNPQLLSVGMALMFGMMLLCGSNASATLAFTREGKSLVILKHLPIDPKTIIIEKSLFAFVVATVGAVIALPILIFVAKIEWWIAILTTIILLLSSVGINAFAIYFDMRKPRLDWQDTSELQRTNNSVSALINLLVGLAFGGVYMGLSFAFSATDLLLTRAGSVATFFGVAFVLAGLLSLCMVFLVKKGPSLFEKMGESKNDIVRISKKGCGVRNTNQNSSNFLK